MSSTTEVTSKTWQQLVATKRQQCRDAIPQEWMLPTAIAGDLKQPLAENANRLIEADIPRRCGILTDHELEITEKYTVEELLKNLASGSLSSLEVTIAFSKRAAIAQQLVSCLTETFFDEAQKRAKELDELRAGGKLAGPLHGLPVSIKDSFKVIGRDATMGYASYIGDTATTNSVLVEVLLRQGAVLYVKTNVPQTMMTADSENNVFGRTLNPWNTTLTAGGSSGGEGALIAMRGSPLGVGTDIAGSVRIPALCCGTYGFRPTTGRIPYAGQTAGVKPGMRFINPCAGPLSNDLSALQIFCKSVLDAEPARYDSSVLDVPWRTTTRTSHRSSLRIGVLPEDPRFPCHPSMTRTIKEATSLLQAAGHTIVPLDASKCHTGDASEVAWLMFSLDVTARSHIEKIGEPFVKSMHHVAECTSKMENIYTADVVGIEERLDRMAALNVKRTEISEAWREIWTSLDLDAVLSPGAQGGAVPHDTFGLPPYTCLTNVLDYPSCVIPFQKVRADLDPEPMYMKQGQIGPNYIPEILDGAPCHVQVFTNRMRDEECLEVSALVDKCLRGGART